MLCQSGYSQRLYRVDGDRLGHLGVVAGGYRHHYCVSPVCDLGAGEGQGVVGANGATVRGIGGASA